MVLLRIVGIKQTELYDFFSFQLLSALTHLHVYFVVTKFEPSRFMVTVLCSLLNPLKYSTPVSKSLIYPLSEEKFRRPPGVNSYTSNSTCLIYSSCLPYGFGRPDSMVSYPAEQALYQIPVRHIKFSPSDSFRFHLTMDTLAFDYGIPTITAPSGL